MLLNTTRHSKSGTFTFFCQSGKTHSHKSRGDTTWGAQSICVPVYQLRRGQGTACPSGPRALGFLRRVDFVTLGLRNPRLQLHTSDRACAMDPGSQRHTLDRHDCSVLCFLLGAESGRLRGERCALLSLSPIGRRNGACGGVPVPAPYRQCRHQPRQCRHQPRQCRHQFRSAQGHSYTASPVHCAIWPRCLKVLLKYLTARSLVSGPREKGLRSPGW